MFKLSEMDKAACNSRRSFNMLLTGKEENNFKKIIFIKDTVKALIVKKMDAATLKEDIATEFKDFGYSNDMQAQAHAEDAYKQIMRYVSSEHRTPIFSIAQVISLADGIDVKVSPDMVFVSHTNNIDTIEVVLLKCSKPVLSQKKAEESLELFSLIKYGRLFVKMGFRVHIKASIYYLRKDNDRAKSSVQGYNFDADFFNVKGGHNVVSIEEDYEKRPEQICMFDPERKEKCTDLGYEENCPYAYMCLPLTNKTDLDNRFDPIIEKFKNGITKDECSDDDCKICPLFDICKYTIPPKAIVKTPVVKKLRDIELSKNQEMAIDAEKGIFCINAGAGAGKTMVIALRTVTLLNKGVRPEEIVLVTFTNAGAEEMRSRINMYNSDFGSGEDISKMKILTFNAFGDEIIKKEYSSLGFTGSPSVIDDIDRSRIISGILRENPVNGLDYRNFETDMKTCRGALAIAKKIFLLIKENRYGAQDIDQLTKDLGADKRFIQDQKAIGKLFDLYNVYNERLVSENMIEFADQEVLLFDMLKNNPYYFEQYGFKHIIVDEFQDSNQHQVDLIKMLISCPTFESLMVVGDDSQAIFGFRKTSPKFIINFGTMIGQPIENIYLLENHRSTPEIIGFANKINARNPHRVVKDLVATRPSGKPVIVKGFLTSDEEHEFIINDIKEQLKTKKPEDIAIIASNKYELAVMGELLTKENIPSVMLNPELYVSNSNVRAAIALSKVMQDLNDTKDMMAFINARMHGGIMSLSTSEIQDKFSDLKAEIEDVCNCKGDEMRDKFIDMLKSIDIDQDEVYEAFLKGIEHKKMPKIIEYCNDFYTYGSSAAFRRNHDYPGIVLTTAHSSKGLEWPVVYDMISKYDTPDLDTKSKTAAELTEEKRRLFFVSSTRARDELVVTGQYVAYGKEDDYTYNKFLIEAYDVVGKEFSVASIETEREMRKEAEKMEKKKAELAKKIAEEKNGKKERKTKKKETAA